MKDNAISPEHYKQAAIKVTLEPIYLCRHMGFVLGNVVKYICRAEFKGDAVSDYKKALNYLNEYVSLLYHRGINSQKVLPEISFVYAFKQAYPLLDTLIERNYGEWQVTKDSALTTIEELKEQIAALEAQADDKDSK